MYQLTLTESQERVSERLARFKQARRDPRRWLRLNDVEDVLAATNDPESFRALLMATTHLEDIIESSREIPYPLWSVLRLPYVITNGPGRKCTAAEMVDAPVWNTELNWMDVLGHLGVLVPAVREAVLGNAEVMGSTKERLATRLERELTPLMFEMKAVAPVLVPEVEALLIGDARSTETAHENARQLAVENATEKKQAEKQAKDIAKTDRRKIDQRQSKRARTGESGRHIDKPVPVHARPYSPLPTTPASPIQPPASTASASQSLVSEAVQRATAQIAMNRPEKKSKTAVAEAERKQRALAVGIADTEAANDQFAHQLVLPIFG